MSKDLIRYDLLVQDALKGVVRKVLVDAAREGLGGDHHLYVSFRTDLPGVRLSNRLREKYPQDMTIVLQHQYWDLVVTEHSFEVGLSFSGIAEKLLVPFDALTGFFDPSVQFGLKFELKDQAQTGEGAGPEAVPSAVEAATKKPAVPVTAKSAAPKLAANPPAEVAKAKPDRTPKPEKAKPAKAAEKSDGPAPGGEVVSLDAFRKKS